MMNTEHAATRTLTLVLPESQWRALRDVEPDALGWLQARIRERLSAQAASKSIPATDTSESWDEY